MGVTLSLRASVSCVPEVLLGDRAAGVAVALAARVATASVSSINRRFGVAVVTGYGRVLIINSAPVVVNFIRPSLAW